MPIVLITGGSGLIGSALTTKLLAGGFEVRHLGRTRRSITGVKSFLWDIDRDEIDVRALGDVDHIIHLAGAGIADERWTRSRIEELVRSRTASADLLLDRVKQLGIRPTSFISAAGIGYYGALTSDRIFTENDPPGNDTIAFISREWEKAVDRWIPICRVVKLRTPVVLSAEGGALPKLIAPIKFGAGAALGRGNQWMPWVHISDLVRIYELALRNEIMQGAYNAGPTTNDTNRDMMRSIAKVMRRPFFLPNVPAFALRLALGELSSVLLEGSRASDQRIRSAGFEFEFTDLRTALTDLLGKRSGKP